MREVGKRCKRDDSVAVVLGSPLIRELKDRRFRSKARGDSPLQNPFRETNSCGWLVKVLLFVLIEHRSQCAPVAFHSDRISKLRYRSIYHRSPAVYALVAIYRASIVFIVTKARESGHDLWLHNRYFGDDLSMAKLGYRSSGFADDSLAFTYF